MLRRSRRAITIPFHKNSKKLFILNQFINFVNISSLRAARIFVRSDGEFFIFKGMMKHYKIIHYTENGKDIFLDWLKSWRDIKGKDAIVRTISKVSTGNLGDNHYCRDVVWEFRINVSAGYRIYYSVSGDEIILLLCGCSKSTQQKDINRAVKFLKKYKEEHK